MIIKSILDTDLYKFTTSYAYIKLFPYAIGTFSFKDRDETVYSDEFLNALKEEFNRLKGVGLTSDELEYMSVNCRFMPRVYWEWLSSFRFNPEIIEVYLDEERHLHIEVTDYLYKVTLYEVPILAIVSEIKNYYCPIKILQSHKIRADFICEVSPFSLDFSRQTQKYTF